MEPENTCVLSGDGTILSLPSRKPYPHKPTYETSNAGAGIHSHGIEYFLVTMINLMSKEFQIKAYPKTTAVLVPNHVWRAGEESSRRLNGLHIRFCCEALARSLRILGDSSWHIFEKHLFATHETAGTKDDIKILHSQVEDDPKQGVAGAVPIPPSDAGKEEVIAALVANVDAMIKADRKITALKQLQGHIWRTGFESNELEGEVFDDVPEALEKWHSLGTKPGNGPLPESRGFKTINSFAGI
ncbi:putative bifunctional methylthioribulose-1-phosphate dehydratase/enolase-phosphatase E1 [Citrus sinensis]|nr:putative bifunctional methylthioribulose-1-phosphate dehydratase/enolase-phosphatase E1 [Citrus sinensis]